MSEKIEYTMSSGWGDALGWFEPKQFNGPMITNKSEYSVVGFKKRIPRKGDTMKAEFERSWITFKFIEINPQGDPRDMFFGKVTPIKQEMKEKTS